MLWPVYNSSIFINPWFDPLFYTFCPGAFGPSPLDYFVFANSTASLFYPPYAIPSLWRYTPDLSYLAMGIQDAALQSEYWAGLEKNLRDSQARILLTASQPPVV